MPKPPSRAPAVAGRNNRKTRRQKGPIIPARIGRHESLNKDILDFMLELEITPEAFAQQRQKQPSPLLLDVREPWEYQTASIPNSLLMPMGDVSSRAHAELDPDAPIVVVCHHGVRSLNVALWLRDQGFTHAQSLSGGIDAWSRTVDPTIPRY